MPEAFHVLISSAGRRVALARLFRKALAELGLPGRVLAADCSRVAAAFHDCDAGFQAPRCREPDFVPRMLELCRAQGVKLVIPTIDPELPILAAARSDFQAAGATVGVSAPPAVEIGNDKGRTHDWLVAEGFPTVRQASAAEVLDRPDGWAWPLLAKPRGGSASVGIAKVAHADDLARAAAGGEYIVQEFAAGDEYTVDVYVDRSGRCRCAVPRRRIETRAGEVSKGVTVRAPALIELATRLAERLPGAWGALNVQIFADRNFERLNVIELNPRFGGGYPLAWEAGARFPEWLILEALGRPLPEPPAWRDRLLMLRYDDAVFVEARAAGLDG
ncbi:MAG: ATP-grasp domain-containing protein [Planctomycetota bacterium]|nr:ATP-grasp domain-containing protein [Planctomycetota bacterium]